MLFMPITAAAVFAEAPACSLRCFFGFRSEWPQYPGTAGGHRARQRCAPRLLLCSFRLPLHLLQVRVEVVRIPRKGIQKLLHRAGLDRHHFPCFA
jgi:hypothetical protein